MNTKNNRFARGTGMYVCAVCKKQTRQTDPDSAGVGLCGLCYEVAGIENQHSDMGHECKLQECEECLSDLNDKAKDHCLAHPELFS